MRSPKQDTDFRRLFDEHHASIQAYCWRRLPADSADDAAAEVFLTVWRRLDAVPSGADARLWIFGIARNIVRNTQRRHRSRTLLATRASTQQEQSEPDPETVTIQADEDARRLELLQRLKPEEREILLLKTWEELTSAEIGTVLGISQKAVDNRLVRIRRKLRRFEQAQKQGRRSPHLNTKGGI